MKNKLNKISQELHKLVKQGKTLTIEDAMKMEDKYGVAYSRIHMMYNFIIG